MILVFVWSALVQDGLSSRYHMNNNNMNHFRHFTLNALTCHFSHHDNRHALSTPLSLEVNEVALIHAYGVCVDVCVVAGRHTRSALPRRAGAGGVCVCQHLHTRSQPVGGIPKRRLRRHCPPVQAVVQRPSRASSRQPPPPPAVANQSGGARSPAVHLRDIVTPYSTGWGRTAVPEACGRVGCIDYKAVPDWLDPAE